MNGVKTSESIRSNLVAELVNSREKVEIRQIGGTFALKIRTRSSPSNIINELEGIRVELINSGANELTGIIERRVQWIK